MTRRSIPSCDSGSLRYSGPDAKSRMDLRRSDAVEHDGGIVKRQESQIVKTRFNYGSVAPGVYSAMEPLEHYLERCGLEKSLRFLIQLRASQLNGCAFCIDMHWKDLRAAG